MPTTNKARKAASAAAAAKRRHAKKLTRSEIALIAITLGIGAPALIALLGGTAIAGFRHGRNQVQAEVQEGKIRKALKKAIKKLTTEKKTKRKENVEPADQPVNVRVTTAPEKLPPGDDEEGYPLVDWGLSTPRAEDAEKEQEEEQEQVQENEEEEDDEQKEEDEKLPPGDDEEGYPLVDWGLSTPRAEDTEKEQEQEQEQDAEKEQEQEQVPENEEEEEEDDEQKKEKDNKEKENDEFDVDEDQMANMLVEPLEELSDYDYDGPLDEYGGEPVPLFATPRLRQRE